jgi:hypothetical protein
MLSNAGKCYVREGVNHLENCGKYRGMSLLAPCLLSEETNSRLLVDRYIQLLKENREKGYRGQQQNYIPGVTGPAGGPEIATNYPTVQQAFGSRGSDFRKGNTAGTGKDGADRY